MSAIHINPSYSRLLSTNKLQEEDDRIVEHVTKANGGDVKWSSLRLPGRIGEQIKQRWENILDPKIKKGVWTEAEMKILRDSQKVRPVVWLLFYCPAYHLSIIMQ